MNALQLVPLILSDGITNQGTYIRTYVCTIIDMDSMTIQYIYSVYMSFQYNCPAKHLELFSLLLQLIGERFGFQSNKMNAVEDVLSDIVKKVKHSPVCV